MAATRRVDGAFGAISEPKKISNYWNYWREFNKL